MTGQTSRMTVDERRLTVGDVSDSTTVIDMQNWGMSNPAYREHRKRECREIIRRASVISIPLTRRRHGRNVTRSGDYVLLSYKKRAFDNALNREAARRMLSYIERFEAEEMSQNECEQMLSAMQVAVRGMRTAAAALARDLTPVLQRTIEQLREFGEAMEKALEEQQRNARFVQPYADRSGSQSARRRDLRADGRRRMAFPGGSGGRRGR